MNLTTITFQPVQWWILAIFILGAIGVMIFYLKHLAGTPKIPLWLRFFLFLLLFLLIFQPAKIIQEKLIDKPALAILIDTSGSMTTRDPLPRLDSFKKLAAENSKFIQNLNKKYSLYPFLFSSTVEQVPLKDISAMNLGRGQVTDIGLALRQVPIELEGQRLAGILLISDGIHNGQWDPLLAARNLEVPVSAIGVGSRQEFQDLAISDVAVSDFVFSNTPVKVEISVTGQGYRNREITLILKEGAKIIKTQKVKIPDDKQAVKTKIEFIPTKPGHYTYTLTIPPYKGEFSPDNNNRDFTLEVLREKIRVLYICGEPSWEYKFLREVLKSDPNIELISFIILRNPENITIVPETELSLIPFPVQEIFLKELFDFDLLIFENFSYTRFFPAAYLENVKKFVQEKGKAFLILGGDKSFGRGEYKGTALDAILPVEMEGYQEKMVPGKFKLQITDFAHPLVQLGDSLKESQQIWQDMPELDGANKITRAKPETVVLGVHPWAKGTDQNLPVLVVWQKGKGRVMALTSNTTWRWSLGLAGQGKTSSLYSRFWQKAVRWLIQAPEVKLVRLATDKKQYLKGERIKVIITVFDEYYHPLKNARIQLEAINPIGKKIINQNNITEVQPGQYETEFESDMLGKYTFGVMVYKDTKLIGKDTNFCEVTVSSAELTRLNLDEDLLKQIAALTKGKYIHIEDLKDNEDIMPGEVLAKVSTMRRQIPLWDSVYLYFLIIIVLGLEWYLRRKSGML